MSADSVFYKFPSDKPSYPEKAADFLASLLKKGVVEAVAVPCWINNAAPAYTLAADPAALATADPFAPVMLRNAADLLAELTRQGLSQKVAVVVRSCEMRALFELVKLRQARLDNVLLIGADCLGTVPVTAFPGDGVAATLRAMAEPLPAASLRNACQLCANRVPPASDLTICALGLEPKAELIVEAKSEKGKQTLETLAATETAATAKRQETVDQLHQQAEALAAATDTNLLALLGRCARCYNCRDMCPICYCPECFFTSQKLGYSSDRYLEWAKRKGSLAFPTDTLLFHLTRMNHMIASCVGCGICESACPNDIPLGKIYAVLRRQVQKLYDYEAGRSLEEPLPMSVFFEKELHQVEE